MDAIGQGFFVPVFFVLAGARVDVRALLDASDRLLLIPGLIVAIYAIKTVPMWLYRHHFTVRENLAAGALQSAQLTLTVADVGGDRTSDRNDRRGTRFGADRRRVDQHDHRAHRLHSPDGRQPPARRAVTNEI